jgi:adenylate cyclase
MKSPDSAGGFERRLATILSGDVHRFSASMGEDDEATLSRLLVCREIIRDAVARLNGRLFGVVADSWMAEFASPVTAVRCAAECQRTIEPHNAEFPENKQIRYRMGLHLGDVIVEGSDLFGDEVNIAARLQEICEPGQLVLSDAVFRHVLGKVDLPFRALGPKRLKHIAQDVSAFAARVNGQGSRDPIPTPIDVSAPVPGFGGKPAIAVIPFETAGGVEQDEHIGDGFALDLIDMLSNLRWLPVISSASSFIFKGHALDAQTIGRALGARYLVTGSFRRIGANVQLAIALTDASNALNLWSQRYRLRFNQLSGVEDDIVACLASLLGTEVERAEQWRLRETKADAMVSWELIRRGIWHLQKFTKEDAGEARRIFELALSQDPGSAEARIQLAWWHFWNIWTTQGDVAGLRTAERLAREALAIDPRDARAHLLVGIALLMLKEPYQARAKFAEAIAMNPSLATAYACRGSSFTLAGDPEPAIAPLLLSMRLNPHDPFLFHYLGELAIAYYMQRDWASACEFAGRSLQLRAGYWYAKAILVASLARGGEMGKARELASQPSSQFSAKQVYWLPFLEKKWNAYLLDGLKLAGCRIAKY